MNRGYRWGTCVSEIGFHGGRVKVPRPRVRDRAGKEVGLPSWEVLRDGDLLLEWVLNLMVLNVSTRKYRRAVRLLEGDLPGERGDGTSKRRRSLTNQRCLPRLFQQRKGHRHRMAAKRIQFSWRWECGMYSTNLDGIWGMSV